MHVADVLPDFAWAGDVLIDTYGLNTDFRSMRGITMKYSATHINNIMQVISICIVTALLTGCASLSSPQVEKKSEYSGLGDPNAELAYNTAFPVVSVEEAVARGDEAMMRGDLDRALFEYLRALDKKGADGELLYKVGQIHLARKDMSKAELSFVLVLKEESGHAGALTELGRIQMQRRDYAGARKLLLMAREIVPNSARIFNSLGVLEDMTKNHQQAQDYFARAIELNRNNPLYRNNMGYSRYLIGDQAGAEQAFIETLRLDPGYERAWRNLALVYAKTGRFNEALDAFGKVEEEHQALNDVGYVAMLSGRYADADHYFNEAIRQAPMYYELANRNIKQLDLVRDKEDNPGK
jgi:Flp pilus assembly protein TadD